MSYRLADGSMSTDYEVGDDFTHYEDGQNFIFEADDGSSFPWFTDKDGLRLAISWCYLIAVNTMKFASTINQLRETIKQLEATIKELEQ
jgi:hypothetical protein